jgi:hypothetical protein
MKYTWALSNRELKTETVVETLENKERKMDFT